MPNAAPTSTAALTAPRHRTRLRLGNLAPFFRGRAPGQLIIQYTGDGGAAAPLVHDAAAGADSDYTRTWWEDVRYMRACAYYSGRVPPDYAQLARFGTATHSTASGL